MMFLRQGPLRIDDELIFYYGSSSFGKNEPTGKRVSGGGIFRARLRPDGFVSVDGGTLTTRPLRFEGQTLSVNGVGPITVALLDENETVLGSAKSPAIRCGTRSRSTISPSAIWCATTQPACASPSTREVASTRSQAQ